MRYAVQLKKFNRLALILSVLLSVGWGAVIANDIVPARLLVLGDSLTAGYGVATEDAFPAQLEKHLRENGHAVKVINAGVSGDTSAGGLARLDWALADKPGFVLLELGANDGLRGLSPAAMKQNLAAIIEKLQARNIRVLLAGMRAPPNLGPDYEKEFNAVFPALAKKYNVMLYPFFLEGVAAVRSLNQRDGIHPNPEGVRVIVDRIAPYVVRLLTEKKQD